MSIHEWIQYIVDVLLEYGSWGLAFMAFVESSFFPIPPDVLLIPLSLMDTDLAWWYALVTTIASTLGAILGMWIGKRLGRPILLRFIAEERIDKVEGYFSLYGGWAVFIAAFTPIPFKVFTVAAGVFEARMSTVLIASFIGRGARFFLIAGIIVFIGDQAMDFISKYLGPISFFIAGVVVLFGYLYVRRKKKRN